MYALKRCLALVLVSGSSALVPAPQRPNRPAATERANPTAKANAQSAPSLARRPSGRAPSFSSQDLTHLVQNELAPKPPKPWLPPTLSFRADFPKTAAAVSELKGSVKASVADLKKSVSRSVEAVPIYRSAQSIARRVVPPRRTDAAPRPGAAQDAPAAPPRRSGRAPGLTSQDVASFVERELPSTKFKD